MSTDMNYGTGRRKTSTARVYIRPGKGDHHGQQQAAGRVLRPSHRADDRAPAARADPHAKTVSTSTSRREGGGTTGQAGAIRHGLTRALVEYDLR
jgi:small subunit ribosomal protein S9